jgi:hypothetical protein
MMAVRSEKIAGWKCLVDLSHDRPDQFHKILKKEPTVGRSLLAQLEWRHLG